MNHDTKKILDGTLRVFNEKGIKFTMDDIAHELSMSKKTIYQHFHDKEDMVLKLVDYLFDGIKEEERKVVEDTSLSTVDKIRRILGVMPQSYTTLDFEKLYLLRNKYPKVYKKVEDRLETGWEQTILLLEQGKKEVCVRDISIPILKMMLEASLEQFFQRDVLVRNGISYQEGLQHVVDILVDGIVRK